MISFFIIFVKKSEMAKTEPITEKVQAILRMDPDKYETIRRAARRSNASFNTFAVEALLKASAEKAKQLKREDLIPDKVLASLAVDSFVLSAEDLSTHPRIAKLLTE